MGNDALQPQEITLKDVGINSLGAFIAGISGSILLLVFVLLSSSIYDIPSEFRSTSGIASTTNIFFPFFLSFVTFVITELVLFISYIFLSYTAPEKYERSSIIFGQIAFVSILIYIFITPVYIYTGVQSYDNIIYVFIVHILILFFSLMLLLEVLNNYRYLLVGFYGSIVSIILTGFLSIIIFTLFSAGTAKLIALLILLPLVNFMSVFFKGLFEYLYFIYYKHTGSDNLGDIFHQLELEAIEELREAEDENTI